MTRDKPTSAVWSRLRVVGSWLLLAADVVIVVAWVVTIASALSGDWPHLRLWIMLLGATGVAASRRVHASHRNAGVSLYLVSTVVMVVALFVLGR